MIRTIEVFSKVTGWPDEEAIKGVFKDQYPYLDFIGIKSFAYHSNPPSLRASIECQDTPKWDERDLCYGNWVNTLRGRTQFKSLYFEGISGHDGNKYQIGDIRPIKLTCDIIEKNKDICKDFTAKTGMMFTRPIDNICLWMDGVGQIIDIPYVHTFQNLIWLFIKKEISL